MASGPTFDHVHERVIAGALISEIAGKMSQRLDTFATWLLAGFGAAVALMLVNHEALTLLPVATVRAGLKLFVWAVIVTVIQKYLADNRGCRSRRHGLGSHDRQGAL